MPDLTLEVSPHASFAIKDQRQRFIAHEAGMLSGAPWLSIRWLSGRAARFPCCAD